ncbi:aspartate 1-decarboxylase [Candidatus Sumerlaeota bacterium]
MSTIQVLKSKIHGATVTEANLDYQGSIGIDADLIEAARLCEYERVLIADLTGGGRLETYVISAERGSGTIAMNGAAAHIVGENHKIIIFSWVTLSLEELSAHQPKILFMDQANQIAGVKTGEINGPVDC